MDIQERMKKSEKYHRIQYKMYRSRERDKVSIDGKELSDVIMVNNYIDTNNFIEYRTPVESDNIFQAILQKVYHEETYKKQDFAETYLEEKRTKMKNQLTQGKFFYDDNHYVQAYECFEKALNEINNDCYPDEYNLTTHDIIALRYALALCNIKIKTKGSLQTAISQLTNLINDQGWGFLYPCLYLALAEIHFILKEFQRCENTLLLGIEKLVKCNSPLFWPATQLVMNDTSSLRQKLENLLDSCKNSELPDVICFYKECLSSGNIQKVIYFG